MRAAATALTSRCSEPSPHWWQREKWPKSGKGRTLALSASLVEELCSHRLRQAEELLKGGVRLSDDKLVVTQADGTPLQPDTLTQDWFLKLADTPLSPILLIS